MATAFLTRTITSIREIAGEPAVHPKYSDARLILWIERAYAHVLGELNRRAAEPIVGRFDITLSADHKVYQLPPIMQRIYELEMLNASGEHLWDEYTRGRYNPTGPGITINAHSLVFDNLPVASRILRIHFVPSGTARLHQATAGTIANDTGTDNECTIVLQAAPTLGDLDKRPNAYAGSILRILSATGNDYVQDRIITAYNVVTRTATVMPNYTAALLPGGTVLYEIAPPFDEALDMVIATYVAKCIVAIEGSKDRQATIGLMYLEMVRDVSQQFAFFNALSEGTRRNSRLSKSTFVYGRLQHRGA